jgi:oligoendopeptidase F
MGVRAEHLDDPDLAAAVWDLEPLVGGRGADGARRLLEDASVRAAEFTGRYPGRVAELEGVALVAAMRELSAIREMTVQAFVYAELSHEVDLADGVAGAFYQAVAERRLEIEQAVRFLELEWAALPPGDMERLLESAGAGLDFAAHHLRRVHDAGHRASQRRRRASPVRDGGHEQAVVDSLARRALFGRAIRGRRRGMRRRHDPQPPRGP